MSKSAESSSVSRQLQQLRRVFENWPTKQPTGADVAFAFVALSTAIEFTVGIHLRTELDKLHTLIDFTDINKYFGCLNRLDENGQGHPYDESVGKGIFLRLIQEEKKRAERLTFGSLSQTLSTLRNTTMPQLCKEVDDFLWGDLQGLSALRNTYAHGRPILIEEDEDSRHNFDASAFTIRQAMNSMKRMKIISDEGDFLDRAGVFFDVLGSTMCITFYWRRVGEFISSYVAGVPYDRAYHPRVAEVVEAMKPLVIEGVDCI